ncbi:DNA-binding PadR family transcriptional regulator [Paenibacillus castaneae]|uniref:PadR family transcriptional regulator n=1 Tax=Paenibacillus castaneae TaxID=474957 RepID=UPI000C9A8A52|nr:PadR family transcriptional regulator [Paenibacillus castaneae]NIK78512.1 DNA-binding PadR family transcriptional regulator [Paenibacillus castaneae]
MKINKELLKGSTVTLILKLLERNEMYGYEIIKEMEKKSGGVFLFKEGTLYPILHTLETEEWVQAYWQTHEGRKRKYYRITETGISKLEERKQEWSLFRNAVDCVLGEGKA